MKEKLVELLENEEFVSKILSMKTDEEVRNEFKSNGVELSDEELSNIKKTYGKIMEGLEKLDDDTLEELSGGGPLDIFRTPGQIMRNKFTDAVVDNIPRMASMVLDGLAAGGHLVYGYINNLLSKSDSKSSSSQAAASSNASTAGAVAAVVALSAGACIIYKNRRAIKRWWNS